MPLVVSLLTTLVGRWLDAVPAIDPIKFQLTLEVPPEFIALAAVTAGVVAWMRRPR